MKNQQLHVVNITPLTDISHVSDRILIHVPLPAYIIRYVYHVTNSEPIELRNTCHISAQILPYLSNRRTAHKPRKCAHFYVHSRNLRYLNGAYISSSICRDQVRPRLISLFIDHQFRNIHQLMISGLTRKQAINKYREQLGIQEDDISFQGTVKQLERHPDYHKLKTLMDEPSSKLTALHYYVEHHHAQGLSRTKSIRMFYRNNQHLQPNFSEHDALSILRKLRRRLNKNNIMAS